jgi:hypothetical protein
MAALWEALCAAYDQLGLDEAVGGDAVFRQLVLARIIEPTSKQDSLRVLAETGIEAVSYATVKRGLQGYADDGWRRKLAAHAELGPTSLVMFDVSTVGRPCSAAWAWTGNSAGRAVEYGSPRQPGSPRRTLSR